MLPMKAIVLRRAAPIESAPLRLEDLRDPIPGVGELRIRVRACGVCHTDLHLAEGDLAPPSLPLVLGHQIVGVVDAVGPEVPTPKVGERVGVPWLGSSCGLCVHCFRGRENLCDNARFTGFHHDGGFAELAIARAEFVCPLPDAFSDAQAAPLLCAGIVGFRALRRSGVCLGERVGLFGFGASAHIAIQVARHWGCVPYVFTRSANHRKHAEQLGAVWVGGPDDRPPKLLHRAISFAPAGALVPKALSLLEKGGVLSLATITMDQIPAMDYARLFEEREIRSTTAATREDARELLSLAPQIPLRVEVERFALTEANWALASLKTSAIRGAGVLEIS